MGLPQGHRAGVIVQKLRSRPDWVKPNTAPEPGCRTKDDASLQDASRTWGGGWRRYFFPAFWLVYLGSTIDGVSKHSSGAAAVVGYVLVAAFAATYLIALPIGWGTSSGSRPVFWWLYALAVALTVAECFFAGGSALGFTVYIAVLTVASRTRISFAAVTVLVLANLLLPRFIHSWGGKVDWDNALTVGLVSFAMFGFFMIIRANIELSAARAEVARLAAENERSRIARDLHDLLGHSLTTITVKAGLARRLSERDPQRAAEEIAEVEQLTRRTLGEVRAAVAGYREVSLAGELASAREVLRAAGIDARLPNAIDAVDADAVELFGWVVREAVTNVVRHSRADMCTITVGPRWVEIADDGKGSSPGQHDGNGLAGLRERVAAAGGTVTARGSAQGWKVRAELAPLRRPATDDRARVDA